MTNHRPLRSGSVRVRETADGTIIEAALAGTTAHPWKLSPRWVRDSDVTPAGGYWAATVEPGFVNGRDVTVGVQQKGATVHVPIFSEESPALPLRHFRNPVASSGAVVSDDGAIILKSGEGYPAYFNKLGVVEVTPDMEAGGVEPETSRTRTRQIRVCDVVLATPRLGARQDVSILNPGVDAQAVEIGTVYDFSGLQRAPSAHWLFSAGQWLPPQPPTVLDRLLGTVVEPTTDELRIAAVWLVSPRGAEDDAEPDHTWTPYPQHFVFRHLNHASRSYVGTVIPAPLQIRTGLIGGLADQIFNAILQPINDAYAALMDYMRGADFTGRYWTV